MDKEATYRWKQHTLAFYRQKQHEKEEELFKKADM